MLESQNHWVGSMHYWLAEWTEEGEIVAYGAFRLKDAHRYVVQSIMKGEKVALAFSEEALPLLPLLSNLAWEDGLTQSDP